MLGNMTTTRQLIFFVLALVLTGCSSPSPVKTASTVPASIMPPAVSVPAAKVQAAVASESTAYLSLTNLYVGLPVGSKVVLEYSTNLLTWTSISTNWWFGQAVGTMTVTGRLGFSRVKIL
jgi:hypothetical protein